MGVLFHKAATVFQKKLAFSDDMIQFVNVFWISIEI